MHLFLTLLAVLIGIVVLLLIAGLFITKKFHIATDVVIPKSKQEVFDYIRITNNQHHYNKWWMQDPNNKTESRGIDGTLGFVIAWESTGKQAGKGEQEITKIVDGSRIEYELRFEKPFKGTSYSYLTTETVSTGTKVTWVFYGETKYPLNVLHAVLGLSKVLRKDLTLSLENLKKIFA